MSYSYFAAYYDKLTVNVDYQAQADYLTALMKRHHHDWGVTLDLACGTGSLTAALCQRGVDIFGCDGSAEMLSAAQQKAENILFIRQKMQNLMLPQPIDTCICTLDSINHLPSAKEVQATLQRVSEYLQPNGLFVFDTNTIYKHRHVLGNHCYIYDMEDIFCAWQNDYHEQEHEVVMTLDFFEPDGKVYRRYTEQFSERAYSMEQWQNMAETAGFAVEAVYHEGSFEELREDSQRAVYVLRKKESYHEQ